MRLLFWFSGSVKRGPPFLWTRLLFYEIAHRSTANHLLFSTDWAALKWACGPSLISQFAFGLSRTSWQLVVCARVSPHVLLACFPLTLDWQAKSKHWHASSFFLFSRKNRTSYEFIFMFALVECGVEHPFTRPSHFNHSSVLLLLLSLFLPCPDVMFHSLWPPSLCFSEWQRGREQWWCSIGESEHATDWHLSGELRRQARLLLGPDKDGGDGRKSHESWGEKQQNKVGREEEDRRFVRCAQAPYCGLRRLCQMRMGNREAESQPFLMLYLLVTICHLFFSCLFISAGRNSLHFFRENPVLKQC